MCFFSNGMSVNLILMCGIAVSSSPAACSFLCFWLTSLRKHPFVLARRRWGLQVSGESQTSCARLVSSIIRTLTRRAQLVCDSPDSLQDETDYLRARFPYDRPDRPSRLKKCSDDRDDHMGTLPRRSQTTRTTETTSIAWIELSRDDRVNFEAIIWKRSQTTETIGTIEGYPRSHHFYSSNRE